MTKIFERGCIGGLVIGTALSMGCGSSGSSDPSATQGVSPPSPSSPSSPSAASLASLASLTIDGAALTPAFSPDIHDYAIRCSAGTNTIGVTATPATGATAALVRPITSPLAT